MQNPSHLDGCLFGFGFVALQLVSNIVNDYADFRRGADGVARVGPIRAAQAGWLSVVELQTGMIVLSVVSFALWAIVALRTHAGLFALWLLSWAGAVAYTAGPWPYGYRGWGDASVFTFFGLVAVAGNCYVQVGQIPSVAWAAALVAGCTAASVLNVNNLRDVEGDRLVGKRTLVVQFGTQWGRRLYTATWAVTIVCSLAIALIRSSPTSLAPLILLPWVVRRIRSVYRRSGRDLRWELGKTAALGFGWCALLSLGLSIQS